MILIIKNTAITDKNWGGSDYPATSERIMEEVDRIRLLSDSGFITDLMSGEAVINDEQYDLSPKVALGFLQNNPIIIMEYYTLVQGDDILIGNGQILYLHDDTWDLDDETLEEDTEE